MSFRFDFQNFSFDSYAFHRHNVISHWVASFLTGYVANKVCNLPNGFSAWLTYLFLTHPVHTESLLYIVGRADLQCLIFILLATLCYHKMLKGFESSALAVTAGSANKQEKTRTANMYAQIAQAAVYMGATFALILISGLCKETGFAMYGLLVLMEGYHLLDIANVKLARNFCFSRIAVVLVVGAATCIGRIRYTDGTKIARMDPYSNPIAAHDVLWDQIMSYWYVHGAYAELLVWPMFLCYDYSMDAVPLITSITDSRLLLPAVCYMVLLLSLFYTLQMFFDTRALWRAMGRASGFGLMFFALSFLPMSNVFFPVGTLIGERLMYLPSFGYLIVGVSFLNLAYNHLIKERNELFGEKKSEQLSVEEARVESETPSDEIDQAFEELEKKPVETEEERNKRKLLYRIKLVSYISLVIGTSLFYYIRTYYRIFDWKDAETITEVDGIRQLKSGRTQFNLGNLYLSRKEYELAEQAYQRSIESDPMERDAMPLYHAGQIDIYKGRWDKAEERLKKAVNGYFSPLTLAEEEVFHDYGMALWHSNKAPEAIYNLQASIITNPRFAKGYNNLACAQTLYGLDIKDENVVNQGLGSLEQAISLQPDMGLYWRNAAVLLQFIGDGAASQNAWNKFQVIDPSAQGQPVPENCVWEFYFR
jgi:tetratricopeptide (TPR) repeat protein